MAKPETFSFQYNMPEALHIEPYMKHFTETSSQYTQCLPRNFEERRYQLPDPNETSQTAFLEFIDIKLL